MPGDLIDLTDRLILRGAFPSEAEPALPEGDRKAPSPEFIRAQQPKTAEFGPKRARTWYRVEVAKAVVPMLTKKLSTSGLFAYVARIVQQYLAIR
jgi:hypothetical protein